MAPASQIPLLYDEDCGFCRFSVALVLAWDRRRRLRPVPIQGEEGQRLLAAQPPSERLASAHVIEPDGSVRSGGALAGPVLERLPGGGPLATLAERSPRATERVYRLVADHRGALGRLVPTRAKTWADRLIAAR
jgi:predicted DCC family thiol-disulfide oxidoreductase YuxK